MGYVRKMQKKWRGRLGMFLAAVFCAVLLAGIPADKVLAEAQGTVTASSANIRSSADTDSDAVASVLKGAKLTIIEETTGADGKTWYKVWVDADTTGYVRADLISKEGSVPTNDNSTANNGGSSSVNTSVTVNTDGVEQVQPVSASVTKDQVRVRADSSTSSSIVTSVKKDVVLTVSGTKAGSANDTWYLVSFMVDGTNVTGYIRSDYVKLNGELLPPADPGTDTPVDPPSDVEPEPEEPVSEVKDYDTVFEDGVWKLVDNNAGRGYSVNELITISEQNADALEKAQKKMSGQTTAIVLLVILVVLLALGITFLVFKLRDMLEEDGFDLMSFISGRSSAAGGRSQRPANAAGRRPAARPAGNRPVQGRPAGARPTGTRPMPERSTGARPTQGSAGSRPTGTRPMPERPNGARPTQGSTEGRPTGTRPAGSRPMPERPTGARPAQGSTGTRPTGARPMPERPTGERPAQGSTEGRPAGARPMPERPTGTRPAQGSTGENLERQARANVETRNLEKGSADSQAWKSKNFMSEDDEFEFEFLNWDGEEEQ